MRHVLVFLIAAMSVECARLSAASECLPNRPAVTVQIHDYVRVKDKSMTKAIEVASGMYKRAGVGIEWLGVVQKQAGDTRTSAPASERTAPLAQLTINIVTSAMAKRGGYADDVVGYVAVPPEGGMGRIGYVIYERIKDVAAGGPSSTGEILGIIIAHDIGRLILGAGSGTFSGIMNRTWNREALQQVNPMSLSFTPPEIDRLNAALDRDMASFVARAGGSDASACVANRDDVATTSGARTPNPAPLSSPGPR